MPRYCCFRIFAVEMTALHGVRSHEEQGDEAIYLFSNCIAVKGNLVSAFREALSYICSKAKCARVLALKASAFYLRALASTALVV